MPRKYTGLSTGNNRSHMVYTEALTLEEACDSIAHARHIKKKTAHRKKALKMGEGSSNHANNPTRRQQITLPTVTLPDIKWED